MLDTLREGRSPSAAAKRLEQAGYNTILLGEGRHEAKLPGQTVSLLLLDREAGCQQIVQEKWTALESGNGTNFLLVGIAREDIEGRRLSEKQLHLAAFELPSEGDYVELSTNSFSPAGKVIVTFGSMLGLWGCGNAKPAVPPTPLTVPAHHYSVGTNRKGSHYLINFKGVTDPGGATLTGTYPVEISYTVNGKPDSWTGDITFSGGDGKSPIVSGTGNKVRVTGATVTIP